MYGVWIFIPNGSTASYMQKPPYLSQDMVIAANQMEFLDIMDLICFDIGYFLPVVDVFVTK